MDLPVTSYEVISNFNLIQECVHGNFTYLVVKWYWLQIDPNSSPKICCKAPISLSELFNYEVLNIK